MRIAVVNWSLRRVGGVEVYLATIVPALRAAGHALALVSEVDTGDREPIVSDETPLWVVSKLGPERVVEALRRWRPDVLYVHSVLDPGLEARLLSIAPAALFTHGYYGTCISGAKSFKRPHPRPCDRVFGWRCLLMYYPRRCGGLSPVTMVRDYVTQRRRLGLLEEYAALLTPSARMENEFLKHGIARNRVHRIPHCVEEPGSVPDPRVDPQWQRVSGRPHLLFLGRMTVLKGGHYLLRALPRVRSTLGRDLRVTFTGDGPARQTWEQQASLLKLQDPGLEISFTGWLGPRERDALLDQSDLLVVPSVWPDPFPLVGIEAARRGVPAAAFAVGGIPDWLESRVNGFLAPSDPPTPDGLAGAIENCFVNQESYVELRKGAMAMARRYSVAGHMARLEPILEAIVGTAPPASSIASV